MITPRLTKDDIKHAFNKLGDYSPVKAEVYREAMLQRFPGYTLKEAIYCVLHEIDVKPSCPICANLTVFINFYTGYSKTCKSRICRGKLVAADAEVREKKQNTSLQRYGVEHWTQNKSMMNNAVIIAKLSGTYLKGQQTFKTHYGVDNQFQRDEIKQKIKKTMLNRYGVDNAQKNVNIRARTKNTNLTRYGQDGYNPIAQKITMNKLYGVDNCQQHPVIRGKTEITNLIRYGQRGFNKIKARETMLSLYGAEYPLQIPKFFEKAQRAQAYSRYKLKNFTSTCGKIFYYQGYERVIIELLLKTLTAAQITNVRYEVPIISYKFKDKNRVYYPDIFIESKRLLIEVKSTYTFDAALEQNMAKHHASIVSGYKHIILVLNHAHDIVETIGAKSLADALR